LIVRLTLGSLTARPVMVTVMSRTAVVGQQ